MQNYDVVIIGGGIVGLATAFKILEQRPKTKLAILEKERDVAQHQSGHNSGVIHSGIYYQPGSLKATNCRRGYELLLRFCRDHEIPFEICGKLIVAVKPDDLDYLDVLLERGRRNGLDKLKKLSAEEIPETEPHATGLAALQVPQAGIIDFVDVARKFREKIRNRGAEIHLCTEVIDIRKQTGKVEIVTQGHAYPAKIGVNCAGLFSDRIARLTTPDVPLRIIPFRGEYYRLRPQRRHLVRNLIYPVPNPKFPFLGVHFTRTIDGNIEAGPNAVLAFRREGYRKTDVSLRDLSEIFSWPGFRKVARSYWRIGVGEWYRSLNKRAFVKALQRLLPDIRVEDLVTGGSGVRAQACHREQGLLDDFYTISEEHFFHVCNAPSPAATSCLAIGETVTSQVLTHLPS